MCSIFYRIERWHRYHLRKYHAAEELPAAQIIGRQTSPSNRTQFVFDPWVALLVMWSDHHGRTKGHLTRTPNQSETETRDTLPI